MNRQPFRGFPARSSFTPLPNLLFAELLSRIDSLAELKLVLHVFWRTYGRKAPLKFVTRNELMADRTLLAGLEDGGHAAEALAGALKAAVDRGVLLRMAVDRDGGTEELYFINDEAGRSAVERIGAGDITLGALPQAEPCAEQGRPDIFTLYEQNIGLLTPMIAEELTEAEKLYPVEWIEEAFKEAVSLNKRSWRYIARILERWSSEGKGSGESGRDSKKKRDPNRYVKGKYGHLVQR